MTTDPLRAIVEAHERLAAATDNSLEPMSDEDLASFSDRGWVKFPLTATQVEELETIAGFAFPPLLKGMLQTRGAMSSFDVDVFGVGGWCAEGIFERNREISEARKEYDWDLPKLVALTADEDFHAVTEDGRVVRICNNEGNIETEHGPLAGWLVRYSVAATKKAEGADSDETSEDPEASYP
jgi:hypothetical protein